MSEAKRGISIGKRRKNGVKAERKEAKKEVSGSPTYESLFSLEIFFEALANSCRERRAKSWKDHTTGFFRDSRLNLINHFV